MVHVYDIIITVAALLLSALFSAYEIAFFSSNKLKIEIDRKNKKRYAVAMNEFIQNPDKLISSLLMGNNVALVVYGIAVARIFNPVIAKYITSSIGGILAIETISATIIVLITAEFLPKALSRLNPNGVFSALYMPVIFFHWLLFPLTFITYKLSYFIMRVFGLGEKKSFSRHVFNKSDLIHLSSEISANQSEGGHSNDMTIFRNALNFSEVKIRECMIPRPEVVAIDIDKSVKSLLKLFVDSGFSRIMVYGENIDDIMGYVHSKDLLKKHPSSIRELMRPIDFVSEEMSAQNLLAFLTKNKKSVAVVRDEFGGTGGIVTMEDLIEEIFGNIEDEMDKEDLFGKKISDGEYIFSARSEVKDVNRKYNLHLPESDDYETIAGMLISLCENIPKEKDVIRIANMNFTVLKTARNRIEKVALKISGI
ncbi:MAG: hemolysin family protein [Bacteroidales bacterium]|jgi:CBS domain containing-hemolysin-like protein|nr:hemolysin family protein [Bacteroidales bacterium]